MRRYPLLALALCGALWLGARAQPPDAHQERGLPWRLPARWLALEPWAFELLLARELPAPLADEDLALLRATLAAAPAAAVRAALVLARSGDARASDALLARLEERVLGPERSSDAGDCVAAAALACTRPSAAQVARLDALAWGARAHPDLETRVECARSALALGRDGALPFLLVVLRLQTHAGQRDARDFEFGEATAWPRSRAAEALSARAGVACTYNADAPIAEREREAARLAELLAPIVAGAPR